MERKGRREKLSFEERMRIERMLEEGYNYSEIGRALNRSRATISREVSIRPCPYNAQEAQNGIVK